MEQRQSVTADTLALQLMWEEKKVKMTPKAIAWGASINATTIMDLT